MASDERRQYQSLLMEIFGGRPVAYWPALARRMGGVKAAVMLSQLLYWNGDSGVQKKDGWIYKSVEDMENETGLTKIEQQHAREKLEERKVIQVRLKGIPRTWHYRVDWDRLVDIFIGKESHPMADAPNEKASQEGRESLPILDDNPAQLNKESESTSETTNIEDLSIPPVFFKLLEHFRIQLLDCGSQTDRNVYKKYIAPLSWGSHSNGTIILCAPDQPAAAWLQERMGSTFERAFKGFPELAGCEVIFVAEREKVSA